MPGGDRTQCGREEEGCDEGREAEHEIGCAVSPRIIGDVPEREERSAQDQAEKGEAEQRIQAGEDSLEQGREGRPAKDDGQHQPNVVHLPDGRHRVVDQRACLASTRAVAGLQIPDAGTEVDAARGAVCSDREQKRQRDHVGQETAHERAQVSGRGPYGTPSSGASG